MKVLTFPKPKRPPLDPGASLVEIFAHIEAYPTVIILFVDNSDFCRKYVEENPWLKDGEIDIILIDLDIQQHFQLNLAPRFDFFINGTPLGVIIGTATQIEFLEIQDHLFFGKPLEVSHDSSQF